MLNYDFLDCGGVCIWFISILIVFLMGIIWYLAKLPFITFNDDNNIKDYLINGIKSSAIIAGGWAGVTAFIAASYPFFFL